MKSAFLLPHGWKLPLVALLTLALLLFVANSVYNFEFAFLSYHATYHNGVATGNNYTDELAISSLILFATLLSLCAERTEDEYITALRLSSWQIAVLFNFGLLLVGIWTVYGMQFLGILYYNLLTPLIIYLAVFHLRLYILPFFRKRMAA